MKLKKGFIMIQNKLVLHFKNIILWIIALFLLTCQSTKNIDVRNCKTNIDINSPINYIHSEPESFQSKFLKFAATVLGMKDGLNKIYKQKMT